MNNTKNLFKKEWNLSILHSPFIFIYALLVLTLLIPEYPYFVAFGYCLIGIPTLFAFSKSNKDIEFTSILPIKRADVVKSRFIVVVFIEIMQLILAIPFAIISTLLINPQGNIVGLDANISLFATTLIEFAVFNSIFLPIFFKTGYKIAPATTFAFVGYLLTTLILELLIALIPTLNILFDGTIYWGAQLALLGFGILVYILTIVLSFKKAVKNFEKVNL